MKGLKIVGLILAALLIAMSFLHSLGGWPALRDGLEQADIGRGSEIWETSAAGWIFGSVSMFVFGVIFASVALSLGKGQTNVGPIVAIGIGYLAFGIGACVLLEVNEHFVGFAVFGLLFLSWAFRVFRTECRRCEPKA